MPDDSSIDDTKNTLEDIIQRRKVIRTLRADNDAARIAACVQMLGQSIDEFLVGNYIVVSCLSDR